MAAFGYDIDRLAEKKALMGLTNAELAKRTGLHASTIANVLEGRTAKGPTVKRIAEVLGLELGSIVVRRELQQTDRRPA